jgi:hypothetical protein
MLPREYTLSQYDSSPPLTACTILVILIDSSFVEQVEEYTCCGNINQKHRIGGVMVSVPASSAVDRGFEPRSGQTKDYTIGICCFSAKHATLRRKSKFFSYIMARTS